MKQNFTFTFELVPGRTARGKPVDTILNFAKKAASDSKLAALSITDNAGGNPALAPHSLGIEIKSLGVKPIIHFSCKDKNRNLIESELFELSRAGLNNLLVVTGDYPRSGYHGTAKPVFDLDSTHVLSIISDMNNGFLLDHNAENGNIKLAKTDFHAGCVVSPFKRTEPEQVWQYEKLRRKINAGARFIISQMGFDIRRFHELRLFVDLISQQNNKPAPPLIGTVFLPTRKLARLILEGDVPGCLIPKRLYEQIEMEFKSDDKGLMARLERGARLAAMLAGIGYDGAHLSGPLLEYEHVSWLIRRTNELMPNWKDFVSDFLWQEEWPFYYFNEDINTKLSSTNTSTRMQANKTGLLENSWFHLNVLIHELCFEKKGTLYAPLKKLAEKIAHSQAETLYSNAEHVIKRMLYDCMSCGDCTLSQLAYLCPQSQCAKGMLNGPCGGSCNGWCEVWPAHKKCIYVRAYERDPQLATRSQDILPPRDWALYLTSSWLNFYLGKTH